MVQIGPEKRGYSELALNPTSPSDASERRRAGIGGAGHLGAGVRGEMLEDETNALRTLG